MRNGYRESRVSERVRSCHRQAGGGGDAEPVKGKGARLVKSVNDCRGTGQDGGEEEGGIREWQKLVLSSVGEDAGLGKGKRRGQILL